MVVISIDVRLRTIQSSTRPKTDRRQRWRWIVAVGFIQTRASRLARTDRENQRFPPGKSIFIETTDYQVFTRCRVRFGIHDDDDSVSSAASSDVAVLLLRAIAGHLSSESTTRIIEYSGDVRKRPRDRRHRSFSSTTLDTQPLRLRLW